MSLSVQFGVLRTRELRELLEDEHKINHIVRCNEKVSSMCQRSINTLASEWDDLTLITDDILC